MLKTITRREFTDAVHTGIHAAGMQGEEAAALVTVARTAKTACRVSFTDCPLTHAGLRHLLRSEESSDRAWRFTYAYDAALRGSDDSFYYFRIVG